MVRVYLERLRNYAAGDVLYRIGHEYVDADAENAVKITMGEAGDGIGGWWELPLPECPDCGGELLWAEAGLVPGARECVDCGSRFSVETEKMPEPEPEIKRYSWTCDSGHRWEATDAEHLAAGHACPTCGDYSV